MKIILVLLVVLTGGVFPPCAVWASPQTQNLYARYHSANAFEQKPQIYKTHKKQTKPGHIGKGNAVNARKNIGSSLRNAYKAKGLKPGWPVYIRLFKLERQLQIWVQDKQSKGGRYVLYKTYPVCNFSGRLGPKLKEGDLQSPEGFYAITPERLFPWSKRYLAMNLGYPNRLDKAHERTGHHLMIHGNCTSEGCFAVTDDAIEEIYISVEDAFLAGQKAVPVHVFPFYPTAENMRRYAASRWLDFWLDIKQAYDAFEKQRVPPRTTVIKGRYYTLATD